MSQKEIVYPIAWGISPTGATLTGSTLIGSIIVGIGKVPACAAGGTGGGVMPGLLGRTGARGTGGGEAGAGGAISVGSTSMFSQLVRAHPGDTLPVIIYLALLRFVEAAYAIEEGGLAGAIGSDDSQYLMISDVQAHVRKGMDTAKTEHEVFNP